jgi:hypothetical protein
VRSEILQEVMCIRNWIIVFVAFLLIAVAAAGCLGVKTPPVAKPTPPSIMLDYHRSGGIAGIDDRLVIFDNGVALFSSRTINRELSLNQTALDRITALFYEAQYSLLQGNFTSRHGGADIIHYTITYRGKTINTEDSAVPPSLQLIIDEMNRIILEESTSESMNQPFVSLTPGA